MAEKRKGSQEPSQSFILDYNNSFYQKAIEIYNSTGRTAQEWQENIMSHILSTNEDELWVHTKFGYSVPRRNGKNEILVMREMYGLLMGEHILHTAHRTTTSHAAWERLLTLLDKAKITYRSLKAVGRELVELEEGGRCEFRTRSSKGGLGEGFDLLIIDEAQEYTDDQESALKYVVTDSQNPQTIFCGTPPTPLSSGTVFTKLREQTLAGQRDNSGWTEWSVESLSDCSDRELWYRTNPSLGTVFTERSVADEVGEDEVDFNIQRLGLWLRYNLKSAISESDWSELFTQRLPHLKGKLFVGIKYGHDGTNVAMSIAVKTSSGKIFVEAIDCRKVRAGTSWIISFLKQADIQAVVIDGANGQQILAKEMKDSGLKKPILPTVKEIIVANAKFEQCLFSKNIIHKGQTSLSEVATSVEKRAIGSNGGFGYKSLKETHEIALLDSVILAHYICSEAKEVKKQRVSY